MTVIYRPPRRHHCNPGWTSVPAPLDVQHDLGKRARSWIPPHAADFPRGTRWRCDTCGQVWVSQGVPQYYGTVLNMVVWRPERWLERRRRERRERAS